jgi:hypothetical protein
MQCPADSRWHGPASLGLSVKTVGAFILQTPLVITVTNLTTCINRFSDVIGPKNPAKGPIFGIRRVAISSTANASIVPYCAVGFPVGGSWRGDSKSSYRFRRIGGKGW